MGFTQAPAEAKQANIRVPSRGEDEDSSPTEKQNAFGQSYEPQKAKVTSQKQHLPPV